MAQVVASVKRERQFGVGRVVHGIDHMGTHTSFGANYRNLDHCSSFKRVARTSVRTAFQISLTHSTEECSIYECKETLRRVTAQPIKANGIEASTKIHGSIRLTSGVA